jgi:Ca2+-binding RTX toxin-like protein
MLSTISITGPFNPGVVTPSPGVRSTLDALGTLIVRGTNSADQVQLIASGAFITVQSRTGNAFRSQAFIAARVQRIRVIGAGGDDRLSMGSGINRGASLLGGEGDDTLIGGNGFRSDTLSGGPGDDMLVGVLSRQHAGVSPLLGDIMVGGSENDTIFGSGGFDQVAGGDGFDTYQFALRETGNEPIVQAISPANGGVSIQVFNDGRPAQLTIPIVEVEDLTRTSVTIKD